MPFVANTPESRVERSDSRNPGATCRGVTSNGRACRRPVSPVGRKQTLDPGRDKSYCWQHKDQAIRGTHSNPGPLRPLAEGDERSSLDTLADRMGLATLDENGRRKRKDEEGGIRSQIRCCFCFVIDVEDLLPPPEPAAARPQPRPLQNQTSVGLPGHLCRKPHSSPAAPGRNGRLGAAQNHIQYILPTTDAQTASALMTELARPYVESEEAGYIYMFWVTPESKSNPPIDAARSLLAPPPSPGRRERRPSDVVSSFVADISSSTSASRSKPKEMLLKIGRTVNVQKRVNQWSQQCRYDIEVVRFYPYIPSASYASGLSTGVVPHMTPHCHRVERLVHIELAGLGLKADAKECKTCGKEHREWFEVEASREGLRAVDEVIRRWIGWDEAQI